ATPGSDDDQLAVTDCTVRPLASLNAAVSSTVSPMDASACGGVEIVIDVTLSGPVGRSLPPQAPMRNAASVSVNRRRSMRGLRMGGAGPPGYIRQGLAGAILPTDTRRNRADHIRHVPAGHRSAVVVPRRPLVVHRSHEPPRPRL